MPRSVIDGLGQGLHGDETTTGAICLSSLPHMAQYGRGVLRLGDKTTQCPRCGEVGTIAEGSQTFKWQDLPAALDGARIQCGCPVGSNRLIARVGTPADEPAPAVPPRTTVAPGHVQPEAQSAAASRSASPPTGASLVSPAEDNEPAEPGFYIVPKSISRRALETELLGGFPSPDVVRKFNALNGSLGRDIVKAGQLVVLSDPRNDMCRLEDAHLVQAAAEVAQALKELTPEDADFMAEHQAQIAAILGSVSTWAGVTAAEMEKHMGDITHSLVKLETLYGDTYRTYGRLNVPEFFSKRKEILAELDGKLFNSSKVRSLLSLGSHPKLQKSLGISSKSLVHHWKKSGGVGPIPGYSNYIRTMERATAYMKKGGYLAIGVGGISSVLTIKEACETGSTRACANVAITETAKFTGMTAGGIAAAKIATKESAYVCYKLTKDPRKFAVCTIAVVAAASYHGAEIGAAFGEDVGGGIFKRGEVIHDLYLYD